MAVLNDYTFLSCLNVLVQFRPKKQMIGKMHLLKLLAEVVKSFHCFDKELRGVDWTFCQEVIVTDPGLELSLDLKCFGHDFVICKLACVLRDIVFF